MGLPNSVIQPLQKVQWYPAILLNTPPAKIALVSHYRMHQVQSCMHVLPHYDFINGPGPSYIAELLHVYTLSLMFHFSSDACILNIQQCKCIWLSLFSPCFGP